jgi:hypothetical protein
VWRLSKVRLGIFLPLIRIILEYSFLQSPLFVSVNVIIVVGHEKLNVEMQRTYGKDIIVVKIPKSGGVSSIWHRLSILVL